MKRGILWVLGAVFCLLAAGTTNAATLNELRVNGTNSASRDYVELKGTPGENIGSLTFISIGPNGHIEDIHSLAGQSFASDSEYFLFTRTSVGPSPNDLEIPGFSLSDSSDFTYLLVEGFSGAIYDDLDTNDDGTLDSTPWTSITDSVAIESAEHSGHTYSATVVPDWVEYGPATHFFRKNDGPTWTFWNDQDAMNEASAETPRASNTTTVTAINETGTFSFLSGQLDVEITGNTSGKSYVFNVELLTSPTTFCFDSGSALSPDGTPITPDTVADLGFWAVEVMPGDYTGLTYNITLDGSSLNGVTDLDKIILVKRSYSGSCYELLDTTRSGTDFTASGLGSFSEFTFATASGLGGSLPVEIDAFNVE